MCRKGVDVFVINVTLNIGRFSFILACARALLKLNTLYIGIYRLSMQRIAMIQFDSGWPGA